jgi:superfamily II DNA or RNA helicase
MIKLRHFQAEVTPACIHYFRKSKGKHPVIALPTGSGKTYAIADLIKFVTKQWDTKRYFLKTINLLRTTLVRKCLCIPLELASVRLEI